MDEIDKLLAKLDRVKPNKPTVHDSIKHASSANYGSIDDLLQSLGESTKQQVQSRLSASAPSTIPIIPEIQVYQADRVTQEQAQQQLYQQRKAALLQQRRQELEQQAQIWLQTMDHHSDEGRWFDEFSCHYESQLTAAIEYFIALQEINSPLPIDQSK
jgi:hypothetical protein